MALAGYQQKDSVVVVYTGEGKGKTSAGLGLLVRALGSGWNCLFVQFMKAWEVGEDSFFEQVGKIYEHQLTYYKGGQGFYNLGDLSEQGITEEQHRQAAQTTYSYALEASESGDFELIVCDEINVTVQVGLLTPKQLQLLIKNRDAKTSLCLTGRGFPEKLLDDVDIATNMTKLKHHFDDKFLANPGIDY
ncbi:cob(I)yrinic acid a,c-diamide adenosyltransferase [Candidatus Microgenomates bacterium]|nr:cob(I)yrinic acid a,c-diamide adenosyltransferase [Candidatus Microgenomates bacterium]